jgi:hypothetical protein
LIHCIVTVLLLYDKRTVYCIKASYVRWQASLHAVAYIITAACDTAHTGWKKTGTRLTATFMQKEKLLPC